GKSASSYKATSGILFLAQPTVKIANSSTGVKVTWNKISGAKGYVVYSSSYNASTKKWSSWKNRGAAAANKTAWVDKSVKSGSYYKYTVKAVNGNYSSTYKSSAGLLYLAQPTVKVSVAENGIKVNWSKSGGAKKYVVYRSVYDNGKYTGWKEMGSFSSSQTTWTDVNISAADIYKYTVRAVNNNAKSSFDSGKIIKGDGGEVSFEPATWKKSTVFNFYKNASAGITDNDKAGYTLKQWQKLQNLEFEGLDDVMRESIESMLFSEEDAESIVVEKGSTEASQYYPKCILTDLSKIKSTSAERLSNGNYKIKIVMQDEDTPLNASSSFLGKITTNVVYWSDIEKALKETGISIDVKDKSLNHKNFTITAEMTPDGKFVSVRHYGEIDFDMTVAIMLSTYEMDMEIVSVIDYTDFKY
ncbi:MAG: fibronectin type III domain-containing protein, partial [Clostridia bacterium]|nr:fibronectin type III domain-containing protein [Clostridia bacterium]